MTYQATETGQIPYISRAINTLRQVYKHVGHCIDAVNNSLPPQNGRFTNNSSVENKVRSSSATNQPPTSSTEPVYGQALKNRTYDTLPVLVTDQNQDNNYDWTSWDPASLG